MKKRCSECKQEKPKDEFGKSASSKDGLRSQCKICVNKTQRLYRENNKEKIKERDRLYQKNNPEKINEISRRYRKRNPEKTKERNRLYYENNKEKIKENDRLYQKNNPEKIKKYQRDAEEKNRRKLGDRYIKRMIRKKHKIPYELISEDMIEIERETIHLNRKVRSFKNGDK